MTRSVEDFSELKNQLQIYADKVRDYIFSTERKLNIVPDDLRTGMMDYLYYGGKMLRPGVLLFSCGAVGGDEQVAVPAAAAIELFHIWTLVHDDLIDQDDKRRGRDTVHIKYYKKALEEKTLHLTPEQAKHYGVVISILSGDAIHGLSISLLTELFYQNKIRSEVALRVIRELDDTVLNTLVSGETLDVVYSKQAIQDLDEKRIIDMLWRKTGALYEFAGRAGALIGLNTDDLNHPWVKAISTFTSKCGFAFQLLDDVLGVVGDEKKLGKPVGSDIREGKKTIVLYHTLANANAEQRKRILEIVGNENSTETERLEVIGLMHQLEGISQTRKMAYTHLKEALENLETIPESKYKNLLKSWAHFLIQRDF
ncbi:polyprenyl synthetase family protein [candidate division KSB1 bacterium]|nr:polyprenyl synthetase family protein [candidate division KSB1 bacterium]